LAAWDSGEIHERLEAVFAFSCQHLISVISVDTSD
jgi:hypothetical protein